MKWYFAINEAATKKGLGLHAKLAVSTARRFTSLTPYLLYFGARNDFTEWMESEGVTVIDARPSYADAIEAAAQEGRYPVSFMGHWLRTEICNIEAADRFVLYTDIDVVFLRDVELSNDSPSFFACAPELREDGWDHLNSGVMLMNIPALRADYPRFRDYIRWKFEQPGTGNFTDQTVYNEFYEGRWSRLDTSYNWKPYWRPNDVARILHFHGPKIHDLLSIIDGQWSWDSDFGRLVGGLFTSNTDEYRAALGRLRPLLDEHDALFPEIEEILEWCAARVQAPGVAAAHGPLACLVCPGCGLKARIAQIHLPDSHLDGADFHWKLDRASTRRFFAVCRYAGTVQGDGRDYLRCGTLRGAIETWLVA